MVKTVGAVEEKIKETQNLLEIAVDFDFTNRENVTVYRYHDGQAQALTQVNARAGANQDGTYYLDRENGLITFSPSNSPCMPLAIPSPLRAETVAAGTAPAAAVVRPAMRWTPTRRPTTARSQ